MLYGCIPILLLTPFTNGIHNWTFNENIIPKNMKEFQDQTNDMSVSTPLTQNELETMLSRSEDVVPNFDEDVISKTSQRFEKIKAVYEQKKDKNVKVVQTTTEKNALRQGPRTKEEKENINKMALERAFALMTQFVYAARYKLTYGQMLRKRYRRALEYKIGYCFALMRDIRQQQLSLYSTLHFNFNQHLEYLYEGYAQQSFADFLSYFQLYEKIVRLDVDMKDVVLLVQKYINMRGKTSEGPKTTTTKADQESYESREYAD